MLAVLLAPPGADAQNVAVGPAPAPPSLPGWMLAWSPLASHADLPRALPRAPAPARLLSDPAPRSGAFWTSGNPAALGTDAAESWSGFQGDYGTADEGFRRPLDPEDPRVGRLVGMGWRPAVPGVTVIGRVDVARERDRPRSRAMVLEPYTSNPWVATDTTHPDVGLVRVRLEGGSAYVRGPWSFGFAVGYEATDARTENPTLPRLGRATQAGASAGVGRSLFAGSLWLGLEGRWRPASEDVSTVAPDALPRVVSAVLHGYAEPEPQGPQPGFRRRAERDDRSLSASGAGRLGSQGRWAAFVRRSDREEHQTSVVSIPEFDDRWRADGFSAGLATWSGLPWGGIRVMGQLRWTDLEGAAERHDLTGAIFRSEESSVDLRIDARKPLEDHRWAGGVVLEVRRESRLRRDLIQRDFTDITTRDVGGAVEVARRVGPAAVSLSYGALLRSPDARLLATPPDGPIREALIDPALAIESAQAVAQSVEVTLAWSPPPGARAWARFTYARVDPRGSGVPAGDRSAFSASVGVVLSN